MSPLGRKVFRRALAGLIDQLEQRRMFSTVTLVPGNNGTNALSIQGTGGNDAVYVYDDPANNLVQVEDDKNANNVSDLNELTTFTNANLSVIIADMKGGNDKLELHAVSTYDDKVRGISVNLGNGNDSFLFTSDPGLNVEALDLPSGPLGPDILDGSNFNFAVHGGSGKDTITLDFSRTSIGQSTVTANLLGEGGDDNVNLALPQAQFGEYIGQPVLALSTTLPAIPVPPTTVAINVDLGGGNNTMNQVIDTTISAHSNVAINVIASGGNDIYSDYEDFLLTGDSVLLVSASLGGGADIFNSELNFQSFDAVFSPISTPTTAPLDGVLGAGISIDYGSYANVIVNGGSGNDSINVERADDVFGSIPISGSQINGLMNIELHGGDGNDYVAIDLVQGPEVHVGPTGVFRGIIDGGAGSDRTRITAVAGGFGGTWILANSGGADADAVSVAFLDNSTAGVSYGPFGGIVLDGGGGIDLYDTEGNGVLILSSVEILDESLEPAFI